MSIVEERRGPRIAGRAAAAAPPQLTPALTFVFALACGGMVANLYYAQPLIGLISPALGLNPGVAGFVVTLTQLGYGAGLLLVVPLADLVENRRIILLATAGTVVGLLGVAIATSAALFLAASFVVGFCSVGTQVLIPFAAHLAPDGKRGRVIGNIMAGLLGGIMLSRPISSFVADAFGWRAIFLLSAAMMLAMMGLLWLKLPQRRPGASLPYGSVLASTLKLLATKRLLQRRAAYQALLFASFNLFWTAVPLLLTQHFGLTQRGIALFALAGAGGALAAPFAGRLADHGWTRPATGLAMLASLVAFLVAGWTEAAGLLLVLVVAGIVIDAATQANQVLSQRAVYSLPAELRGRLNAGYMTVLFVGGACGSALAAAIYHYGGWWMTSLCGAGLGLLALLIYATEFLPGAAPKHG
jgi:predicted MFS family arabinose efflux permease